MGLLPCPEESDPQIDSNHLRSDSSASFLSSQPSLPSVPSLTISSQHHEQPSTTHNHHHCIYTLKGHSSYIFSLTIAGEHLYSGSSNSEIRVWSRDPSSLQNSTTTTNMVVSNKSSVKSIVVLGDKLFSSHQDHKIRVWKIDNTTNTPNQRCYKCIATLPGLNDRITRLFSAKNYVEIRRHKKCTWVHHVDAISALALSKDGSLLYSVSWDRTFKVWRTSDLKCLESVWNAHDDAINAVALSDDGFVYTGSADKKIKVWKKGEGDNNKKHKLVGALEKHKSAVNALALSTDGSVLYSGACDRSIIVWQRESGGGGGHMVVGSALRGHTKAILCLAVVSDLVCSGSADKTVRIWRKGIGRAYCCLAVLEGHRGPVKCLTSAVDSFNVGESKSASFVVYSGGLDCDIKVWQIWVPFS